MPMKNLRNLGIVFMFVLLIGTLVSCGKSVNEKISEALDKGQYDKAVELYNNSIEKKSKISDEISERIASDIEESFIDWSEERVSYENTKNMLTAFSSLEQYDLSEKASKQLAIVEIEYNGDKHMNNAEGYYDKKQYLKAMDEINSIDSKWALYPMATDLYDDAKNAYKLEIAYPSTIKQYKSSIAELGHYLKDTNDTELAREKTRLEGELETFYYTEPIIKQAYEKQEAGKYKDAFKCIDDGLDRYPQDVHLNTEKDNIAYEYIVSVAENVKPLIKEEKYDEALGIINKAQKIYSCDDFNALEDEIMDEKSFIHKISSSFTDLSEGLVAGWKQEVDSVKNEGTKSYIIKSGGKLFLGNYSDDDVTILSTAGNVGISLAGFDFPADARDLVYDVQNWGEGDYFVVHLATDVVALLPVVGAVKYAKYLKKTDASTVGAKNFCKVVLDNKNIKKSPKLRKYRYKKCKNQSLVGKTHPKTKVPFIEKRGKYSEKEGYVIVVVPVFESKANYKLPKAMYKEEFSKQKKYLNQRLTKDIEKNSDVCKQFTKKEVEQIEEGQLPDNYVWHHNEKPGLMQLVDAETHDKTAHTGGMSLWGKGYQNAVGD